MKKKLPLICLGLVAAACIVLSLLAIHYTLTAPYREQLPVKNTYSSLSNPLQEQLSRADRIARYFTTANNLGNLGMVYHSQGDYEKAVSCYKLAILKDKSDWIWQYYIGRIYLEQGRPDAALIHFKTVTQKDPINYSAIFYTALCYQRNGGTTEAVLLFKTLSTAQIPPPSEEKNSFPLQTYAAFQLARTYLSLHKPDSAEIMLTKIITDQETFGPAYRLLAAVYAEQGKGQLADSYRAKANDLGDYAGPADEMLNKIALLSRSEQYLLKQIQDATASRNYQWALKLCNHAMEYYPDNKELVSIAVFENFRQGADEKALSYLDKHFRYFSNDAKELMDVTDILYNKKHPQEAMKYFYQVKKLLPQNSDLPVWLFERGKKDEALAMMNELVREYPKNSKILAEQIRLLKDLGEDDLADTYFSVLKNIEPEGPACLQIKGLLAEEKGNTDSAGFAYEAAYKTDPKDMIFTKKLIDFDIKNKNWKPAIGHFRSALALFPNEPFLLEGIGRLLVSCPAMTLRNTGEGLDYTKRAFNSYRSTYEIKLAAGKTLAVGYLAEGDKKNCIKYINKTIELAREINQQETYVAYFRVLISR